MPRARGTIKLRSSIVAEVLDDELRMVLCGGICVLGEPQTQGLNTLEDWRRAWRRWGPAILAKWIEDNPGTRPVACYVVGDIERDMAADLSDYWRGFDVVGDDGTKLRFADRQWKLDGCEAKHLRRLGVIDADEARRHRGSTVHAVRCLGNSCHL